MFSKITTLLIIIFPLLIQSCFITNCPHQGKGKRSGFELKLRSMFDDRFEARLDHELGVLCLRYDLLCCLADCCLVWWTCCFQERWTISKQKQQSTNTTSKTLNSWKNPNLRMLSRRKIGCIFYILYYWYSSLFKIFFATLLATVVKWGINGF